MNDYDEPRYMAVNSYDNCKLCNRADLSDYVSYTVHLVLRVYDRGMDPPKSDNRLVHTLKGFKNKNWPIRSSFYCGSGCKYRINICQMYVY